MDSKEKTDAVFPLIVTAKHTISDDLLYVGIDIGKKSCVAGFVSQTLLTRYAEFEQCPAIAFDQSLAGFEKLLDQITFYVPLPQASVLVEKTGHYHNKVVEYLRSQGVSVYIMHVKKRLSGIMKTDKRDALSLAVHLYDQLEKGAHAINKKDLVRKVILPTGAAAKLKGMMKHRQELMGECTQRRNKLTEIADELFPELTLVFHDPNGETALRYREHFSTPHAFATASMDGLAKLRAKSFPSNAQLKRLRELAAKSIGIHDADRKQGLVFEQRQLIRELKLIYANLEEIDKEVATILQSSREGQILLSIPGMGNTTAATILATIGTIENFKTAGHLKSYFGWAPSQTQTGTSQDSTTLTTGGLRLIRSVIYMLAIVVLTHNTEWAKIYERLVLKKCPYNARTRRRTGKRVVIGRIAGQMIKLIYKLLKTDQEVLQSLKPGEVPPPPMLYDPIVHRQHREGKYLLQPKPKQKHILEELTKI